MRGGGDLGQDSVAQAGEGWWVGFRTASCSCSVPAELAAGGREELSQCLAWERLLFPEMLFARLENVNMGFLPVHRNSVTNDDQGCAARTQNKAVPNR